VEDSVEDFQVGEAQREVGRGARMTCPKCQVGRLTKRKAKGRDFSVEYCRRCKGVWFDRGEHEQVMPEAIRELQVPGNALENAGRLCPKCRKALYTFDYPQTYVTIDMCKRCGGLWFDQSEFKEVRAVRSSLQRWEEAQEYADVTGFKGALIDFIDSAMKSLPTSIRGLME